MVATSRCRSTHAIKTLSRWNDDAVSFRQRSFFSGGVPSANRACLTNCKLPKLIDNSETK
jgi:hypothetical protein